MKEMLLAKLGFTKMKVCWEMFNPVILLQETSLSPRLQYMDKHILRC